MRCIPPTPQMGLSPDSATVPPSCPPPSPKSLLQPEGGWMVGVRMSWTHVSPQLMVSRGSSQQLMDSPGVPRGSSCPLWACEIGPAQQSGRCLSSSNPSKHLH